MGTKSIIESLSDIEKKALKALSSEEKNPEKIAEEAQMNIDSARRAIEWLSQKGLAEIKEKKQKTFALTIEGKKALDKGLPEQRLLRALSQEKKLSFRQLEEKTGLGKQELNVALGVNKRNAFIIITKENNEPCALLTEVGKEYLGKENLLETAIRKISEKEKPAEETARELVQRGLAEEKETTGKKITITQNGKEALASKEFSMQRKYNIHEPVPQIFIGKKQPYIQFLNSIRKKLVTLGFKEMPERLINQEFYNFDVLFQPQNHPARTWTDTYQLKQPSIGKLPSKEKVLAIKNAHEHGGKTGSKGWGYKWSEEIAMKLMPTAHGTAADARQMVEGVEWPRKYFVINRCFRPDVLDATHLIEFNQLDGFIVGKGLTFANLLGILKDFALEIAGAEDVRFYPDYYPFTEPSVQLSAKHPQLGWVEFAGAGIFRPEITEGLGIKEPVLAWGMGVDRLAMFKLGIKDIRQLFSEDLTWLRNTKMVIE